MTLTDTQRATVERWLVEHWHGQARCPSGHEDEWSVEPSMSFMPGFASGAEGPKIVHEHGFTFVVLTCGVCAYVAFLNTNTIGIGS